MSAAARGVAGAMAIRRRDKRVRKPPADALQQTQHHLQRFVRDPERARELAAEAIAVKTRTAA